MVRYYDFSANNNEHHKPRPAMVLGYNKRNNSLFLMRITSKEGRTNGSDYWMLGDEVKVPENIRYDDRYLYGVIKTNNIIEVKREHVSSTLDSFPETTKHNVLQVYEKHVNKDWYKEYFDQYDADHEYIMNRFKENLAVNKLGFFVEKNKEDIYEFVRADRCRVKTIRTLSEKGDIRDYEIGLVNVNNGTSHQMSISTYMTEKQVAKRWSGSKTIKEWVREDATYRFLKKDLDGSLISKNPISEKKWERFAKFKKRVLERER